MRPGRVVRRQSDITRVSFPFELLHARGPATNMSAFHWHDFLEISFVRSGLGTYEIEDKVFHVGPGDIVIINDTERHRVTYDPARPLRETVLHFSAALLEAIPGSGTGERTRLPLFGYEGGSFANKPTLPPEVRGAIRRLVGEIRREWDHRRAWYEPLIRAKLVEIVCLLMRARGGRRSSGSLAGGMRRGTRPQRVVSWLRSNYHRPVRLAEIARAFSMRPSYFSDYFRRNLGLTFRDYLLQLRVCEAARLIEAGPARLSDVALACGFRTRATFYRAFRRVTGSSPRAWRSKQLQQETKILRRRPA